MGCLGGGAGGGGGRGRAARSFYDVGAPPASLPPRPDTRGGARPPAPVPPDCAVRATPPPCPGGR